MKIAEAMSGNLSVIACEEELNVIVEEVILLFFHLYDVICSQFL